MSYADRIAQTTIDKDNFVDKLLMCGHLLGFGRGEEEFKALLVYLEKNKQNSRKTYGPNLLQFLAELPEELYENCEEYAGLTWMQAQQFKLFVCRLRKENKGYLLRKQFTKKFSETFIYIQYLRLDHEAYNYVNRMLSKYHANGLTEEETLWGYIPSLHGCPFEDWELIAVADHTFMEEDR